MADVAAVAYENLADVAGTTVAASSEEILMPASTILTPHVEERWRSIYSTAYFVVDLGSLKSLDTIWVGGLSGSDEVVARVRVSTTDPSGLSDLIYDSEDLESGATEFDMDYGAIVSLLSEPMDGRYIRVDVYDPNTDYVEVGRIFVGLRTQFTTNFAYGWTVGYVDRSVVAKTRGGQTAVWHDNHYRVLNVSFEFLPAADRYGLVETIDRVNGRTTDILFIVNPDSTNLPRDTIFGLVSDLTPVTNPALVDVFGKQYAIEERR